VTGVHFTATQPTKRMAADCLFTDEAGRVLVLNPPYKDPWDLPGPTSPPETPPAAKSARNQAWTSSPAAFWHHTNSHPDLLAYGVRVERLRTCVSDTAAG
jgi:hypothetical protein